VRCGRIWRSLGVALGQFTKYYPSLWSSFNAFAWPQELSVFCSSRHARTLRLVITTGRTAYLTMPRLEARGLRTTTVFVHRPQSASRSGGRVNSFISVARYGRSGPCLYRYCIRTVTRASRICGAVSYTTIDCLSTITTPPSQLLIVQSINAGISSFLGRI
jgi:hypothetical protein